MHGNGDCMDLTTTILEALCHHNDTGGSAAALFVLITVYTVTRKFTVQYNALCNIYHFTMAALRSRCGHYIFILWFLLSFFFFFFFFFPRLISAVGNWMSTILPHMVWAAITLGIGRHF